MVHAVPVAAADRGDLISTRVVEWVPREQPVVAIVRVGVVDSQLQLALI